MSHPHKSNGAGRPAPPRDRKGIAAWHFGKLAAAWLAAIALLIFVMLRVPQSQRQYYFGVWLVLSLPLVIITWIWFSEREDR